MAIDTNPAREAMNKILATTPGSSGHQVTVPTVAAENMARVIAKRDQPAATTGLDTTGQGLGRGATSAVGATPAPGGTPAIPATLAIGGPPTGFAERFPQWTARRAELDAMYPRARGLPFATPGLERLGQIPGAVRNWWEAA